MSSGRDTTASIMGSFLSQPHPDKVKDDRKKMIEILVKRATQLMDKHGNSINQIVLAEEKPQSKNPLTFLDKYKYKRNYKYYEREFRISSMLFLSCQHAFSWHPVPY